MQGRDLDRPLSVGTHCLSKARNHLGRQTRVPSYISFSFGVNKFNVRPSRRVLRWILQSKPPEGSRVDAIARIERRGTRRDQI